MMRLVALFLLTLVAADHAAAQPAVFLVRHAERADTGTAAAKLPGADPELSAAGHARAAALAAMLKDAKISAIFITEYRRTRDTAQPLAKALGITVAELPSNDADALVERLKAATGNVLVVGHSNSVPAVIKALGVTDPVTIGEQDFDNLFIVSRGSAQTTLLRLHYK
jgi:broad specificity phosphatase PhoE